jgi:D-lyxose ketol-isomerase
LTLQYENAKTKAKTILDQAGIVITEREYKNMEVTDLGLGRLEEIGLQLIVYINTDRVCAKEIVLLPNQLCPEHKHPPVLDEPGKEETFRCRWGEVYLYVPGDPTPHPKAKIPRGKKETFTVWREVILTPGDQYTLEPEVLHWFQAGPQGAVISEFSTTSRDEKDIFSDPAVRRVD